MKTSDALKRVVGYRASELVEDGMVLGLGTGSTVRFLLEALAERRRAGELPNLIGIPTSKDTELRAAELDIPLATLSDHPEIDLALDGADEVDPALDLIKGLGGALLREKVVVAASRRFVVLIDASKRVERLGTKAPLPVEVDPFSLGMQIPFLRDLGCDPTVRKAADGSVLRTDGGNLVVDCRFADGIVDPVGVGAILDSRPGIMEHGLFLGVAEQVLIATRDGCEVLTR